MPEAGALDGEPSRPSARDHVRRRSGVRFSLRTKETGALLVAAFGHGMVLSAHDGATASMVPLSLSQPAVRRPRSRSTLARARVWQKFRGISIHRLPIRAN